MTAKLANLKFRSSLSKKMRDGVTAPCSKSQERQIIDKCGRDKMKEPNVTTQCYTCATAKPSGGGRRKRK